ncbi:SDR family NAD(P)-dependent oxidoreductase [Flavobacterium sp. UMI-01]|uniref:SDR family NAD(P)-dependent oxidoreductase n=1 Tax=Flavobacterium sp. UMI-01 TaxID=1441053 RepID=UPI001C7DDAD4|nr:SDR family oxidoreductase [Flavobacterium sp. UMI-01]GIZ08437.1 oxidoreductase [Flavobacterium sp. UMI-01]
MKNILIIGGSKGIGSAVLLNQLEANKVINLSRNAPDVSHPNLLHHSVDITQDALPEIEDIDALIYCPGTINLKPIGNLSVEDFRNDFEINVMGAVKAIQKYLPILKNSNAPSIVLFSTVATKLGMPYHASVATAKAAIEGLVKSLGAELAGSVRINAIAPTITDTPLAAGILRNERMRENMVERHPLKGYLNVKEVADMVDFLISDKAKSMSGQIITMDYGLVTFKL